MGWTSELRGHLLVRGFTLSDVMNMRLGDAISLLELDAELDGRA